LSPALFSQTFAGLSAPFNARRDLLFINVVTAFPAFNTGLIREDFYFIPADRTFMDGHFQVSAVLTGAMTYQWFYLLG
jgi:hypothetical protein